MALATLIRQAVADRFEGYRVFTEPQVQYDQLPAILIETPSIRSLEGESHYAKQVSLTITVMLKSKKNALVDAEKLVEQIEYKLQAPITGTLSHQWLETTFESSCEQEQPLIIAKLYYQLIVGD